MAFTAKDLRPPEPIKARPNHSRVESMRRQLGATDEELLADYVEDARDALQRAALKAEYFERPELQKLISMGLKTNQRILDALRGAS